MNTSSDNETTMKFSTNIKQYSRSQSQTQLMPSIFFEAKTSKFHPSKKPSPIFLSSNFSSMALLILTNMIFSTITLISNLVSRLLFNVTAYLLVIAIQGLRVPGEAMQSAIEQIGGLIKSCFEYLLEIVLEVISEIISFVFDLVKESVFGSVAATGAAVGGLAEKTRSAFDGLTDVIPSVVEGAVEMVTTMVTDLWNNYMDAQSYVTQNA